MKLIGQYVLTELGEEYVAVPIGEASQTHRLVRLNESGAEIWKGLNEGLNAEQIADELTKKYEVSTEKALVSVKTLIDKLTEAGVIEQ